MHKRLLSNEIYARLCEVIPGGVNSPVRACKAMGQIPMVADHAKGDIVTDVDGYSFIDFCGSWGALILGHAHSEVLQAAQQIMMKGTTFGITTEIEEMLARKIIQLVDSIEKIRFVSTGTEATMSAVRLARGFTQKELIIKFSGHYHGHADFFLVQAGSGVASLNASSSAGIPHEIVQHTLCLPFNDIDACRAVFKDERYRHRIAGVILEPIAGNMGVVPATHEFIQMLREETHKNHSLLIFDEVITGFRVGLKGAQELYNVQADLVCFGKIIGGGFPAAAFGGKKEIMDFLAPLGPVYQAGTLSGNPVAMAAGLRTLDLIEAPGFYSQLADKCDSIVKPIRQVIQTLGINACIQQAGSMFTLFFGQTEVRNMEEATNCDRDTFARFFRFMFANGVYIPPLQLEPWFVSAAHTEENLAKATKLVIQFLTDESQRE